MVRRPLYKSEKRESTDNAQRLIHAMARDHQWFADEHTEKRYVPQGTHLELHGTLRIELNDTNLREP